MYRLIVIDIMSTIFRKSNTSIRKFNQEELDMVQDAVITEMTHKKCCPYCGTYLGYEETETVCVITLTTGSKRVVPADRGLPKGKINIKELVISTDLTTERSTLIPDINTEAYKNKQKALQYLAKTLTQHCM